MLMKERVSGLDCNLHSPWHRQQRYHSGVPVHHSSPA